MQTLLEAHNITKEFPGVTALSDVNLSLEGGKVTALIGENGAGKSTLLKIMSGIYTDYEGTVLFNGGKVKFSNPKEALDLGIAIVHQELNLIPYLSVAQNIFLGRELINRFGFLDQEKMNQKTRDLLSKLQTDVDPTATVSSLKVGQQQVVDMTAVTGHIDQFVTERQGFKSFREVDLDAAVEPVPECRQQPLQDLDSDVAAVGDDLLQITLRGSYRLLVRDVVLIAVLCDR